MGALTLECGPAFFGKGSLSANVKNLIKKTSADFGLKLNVLVYTRANLRHSSFMSRHERDDSGKMPGLYEVLNCSGLPFNLALNGEEMEFLSRLQDSGQKEGVQNCVTIADNALLPVIRKSFPGLQVIASCISAVFQPNIEQFRNEHPGLSDGKFLIEYYQHLYSQYDRVVPLAQLTTPDFLRNFGPELLKEKTIVFLSLYCGQQELSSCAEHYNGDEYKWGKAPSCPMPVIPDEYLVKKEGKLDLELPQACSKTFESYELINRLNALGDLIGAGINKFKIPARCESEKGSIVFQVLCKTMAQTDSNKDFPSDNKICGYTPGAISQIFRLNYPKEAWGALNDFTWPFVDASFKEYYCQDTAARLWEQLHEAAKKEYGRTLSSR